MNTGRARRRVRPRKPVAAVVAALAVITLTVVLAPNAWAGSVSLRWDGIPDADMAGYRLYRGNSPDVLDEMIDVGNTTSTTLAGLDDCSYWYIAVRAYDAGGLESLEDSNLVYGLPRPRVNSLSRSQIRQGQSLTFTVSGVNFDQGDSGDANHPEASVELSHSGLSVTSTQVVSCDTIRITVQATADAAPGMSDLTVLNPDLSWDSPVSNPWVFGVLEDAIEVLENSDSNAPSVSSTEPPAGAEEVPAAVNPLVVFSEAVDPGSVNATTVRLLDADGLAVAQEAGWPTADGAVVTLRPEVPLADGSTYRIHITGGPGGVRDLAGNPMESDYSQSPGFTVMGDAPSDDSTGPSVVNSYPAPGAIGIDRGLSEVRITFDRDMRGLASLLSLAELRERFGVLLGQTPVTQANDSPHFESAGRTVVLLLQQGLQDDHAYTTFVHLDGPELRSTLQAADRMDLFMGSIWMTRAAWRIEGALERIAYMDPQTEQLSQLLPGQQENIPLQNAGVPVNAQFHITFSRPVVASSAHPGVFQVLVTADRRYRPVELVEPLKLIDGGRTVVLVTAESLPAGHWGMVRILTGPSGVELVGESDEFTLPPGTQVSAPFATEVAPEDTGFGVAE